MQIHTYIYGFLRHLKQFDTYRKETYQDKEVYLCAFMRIYE